MTIIFSVFRTSGTSLVNTYLSSKRVKLNLLAMTNIPTVTTDICPKIEIIVLLLQLKYFLGKELI